MPLSDIALLSVFFIITEQTTFNKNNIGITDLRVYLIPPDTEKVLYEHNMIRHVPKDYFKKLPKLVKISLRFNMISDIDCYAFSAVPNIKEMWLGNNSLSIIKHCYFSGIPKLKILYFGNNLIKSIEPWSFRENNALTELFLHLNLLETIPRCLFDLQSHPTNIKDFRMFANPLQCETLCWLKQAQVSHVTSSPRR